MASGKRAALALGVLLISTLMATGCTATKGATPTTTGAASVNDSGSQTQSTGSDSPATNAGVQTRKIKDKAAAQAVCKEISALPELSSLFSDVGVTGSMDVQSDYNVAPEGFASSNQIGTLYCQATGDGNSLWNISLDWWRDEGVYQNTKSNGLLVPVSADAGTHGELTINGTEGVYSYTSSTSMSGGLYQGVTFPADLTRITVNFKAPDGADINENAAHDALVPVVELLSSVSREGK